jgi:hypothetical protein
MGDVFRWVGDSPGHPVWFDVTRHQYGTPGAADTVVFTSGTHVVSGNLAAAWGTVILRSGAHVTFAAGTHPFSVLGVVTINSNASLALSGNTLTADGMLVAQAATFDVTRGLDQIVGSTPPVAANVGSMQIAIGGAVVLGTNHLSVSGMTNGNDGIDNSYNPARGFTGTGTVYRDDGLQAPVLSSPSLDFGTIHVNEEVHLPFVVTNLNSIDDGGGGMAGAIETTGITDTRILATPLSFGLGAEGGSTPNDYVVFTGDHTGALVGQSISVVTQFGGGFDSTITVPITGTVVNYASPEFAVSGNTQPFSFLETIKPGLQYLFLGEYNQGQAVAGISISAMNGAPAPADNLNGTTFDFSPDGMSHLTGPTSFTGLGAGAATSLGVLNIDTSQVGWHWNLDAMAPTDSDNGGLDPLPTQTLATAFFVAPHV